MLPTINEYFTYLVEKDCSSLTSKAVRGDLSGFVAWWEGERHQLFALLREPDIHTWRCHRHRQRDTTTAHATLNRALISLHVYRTWAHKAVLITSNPTDDIKLLPMSGPTPRLTPSETSDASDSIDALLRAVQSGLRDRVRLRDDTLLSLLVHADLCVQETGDIQFRDLDLDGITVTIRRGKDERPRRVMLNAETVDLPQTSVGQPMRPDLNQRQVHRAIGQHVYEVIERLHTGAEGIRSSSGITFSCCHMYKEQNTGSGRSNSSAFARCGQSRWAR